MTWYSWSSLSSGSASMDSPTSDWISVGQIHGCKTHGYGGLTVITRLGIRHSSPQTENPVVSGSSGGCGRGLHVHYLSKTGEGSTVLWSLRVLWSLLQLHTSCSLSSKSVNDISHSLFPSCLPAYHCPLTSAQSPCFLSCPCSCILGLYIHQSKPFKNASH